MNKDFLKLSHNGLIIVSGLMWLAIGCFLLPLGLKLLLESSVAFSLGEESSYPLLNWLTQYVGGPQSAVVALIVIAMLLGRFKGKMVLGKAVKRNVSRIMEFPNPTSLLNLYGRGYLILIAVMIGLGMSMRYFGVPNDIRGVIDVAVGNALIQGAITFFRTAQALKKKTA